MEPFCPFLLAGVSLPLAKALKGNETTTTTTPHRSEQLDLHDRRYDPAASFPLSSRPHGPLPLLLISL